MVGHLAGSSSGGDGCGVEGVVVGFVVVDVEGDVDEGSLVSGELVDGEDDVGGVVGVTVELAGGTDDAVVDDEGVVEVLDGVASVVVGAGGTVDVVVVGWPQVDGLGTRAQLSLRMPFENWALAFSS